MIPFLLAQRMVVRNVVPLSEAGAAAGGGCMLCDEYRVPTKGRLPAIVRRIQRREPLVDEVARMFDDRRQPLAFQIGPLLLAKMKTPSERGLRQALKNLVDLSDHLACGVDGG